ncbi:MAG: FAD binding domain-containing protein [Burkholderiales bacterium]
MNRFEWIGARDLAAAARTGSVTVADAMLTQSGQPGTTAVILKAGGIDLLDLMKEGLLSPRRVVNLRDIPELGRIVEDPGGALRIGSMVTLAQLAEHPLVRARYRALAEAAGQSASPQIRQVATIGGNLLQRPRCWYFRSLHHHCLRKGGEACFAFAGENQYHAVFGHDGCAIVHPSTAATALVAFDAAAELVGAQGAKRVVALEAFFLRPDQDVERENDLKPGEILTAVVLPPSKPGLRSAHLRQGEVDSFDWPIADVAAVVDLDSGGVCRKASVVLGAAAPVPYRAKGAESVLAGKRISEDTARSAARAAVAGAAPLSGNAYKLPVFEALVRRTILSAASRA